MIGTVGTISDVYYLQKFPPLPSSPLTHSGGRGPPRGVRLARFSSRSSAASLITTRRATTMDAKQASARVPSRIITPIARRNGGREQTR
jgi:hypothetical protein